MKRAAAAAAALLLVALFAEPANATTWQRNYTGVTGAFHCTPYGDVQGGTLVANTQVCVVVNGHTWQPVVTYTNLNLWFPTVNNPVNLYHATSANPGVWVLDGNCGTVTSVDVGEMVACFGASHIQPTTTVQAKVASLTAVTEGDTFTTSPGWSPSIVTGS